MHLRCPHCRAPIPERAMRCPVCGGDPYTAPTTSPTPAPLSPRFDQPGTAPPEQGDNTLWWRASLALALVMAVALALVGIGVLLTAAGIGEIAWPAVAGLASALVAGTLVLLERLRARRVAMAKPHAAPLQTDQEGRNADELALLYLHAERFAAPASGRESVRAPLTHASVSAEDLAWRGIAATLTALADGELIELEEHALATPAGPVRAVAVRVVRPLPAGEAFASSLLRPLVRRGVGSSTTVSEAVSQLVLARRHPAATVLALAREQALARGYLRLAGTGTGTPGAAVRGWLAGALLLPPRVDLARLAEVGPALAALEERLATWDARDPSLVVALHAEVRAAFVRERARASRGTG